LLGFDGLPDTLGQIAEASDDERLVSHGVVLQKATRASDGDVTGLEMDEASTVLALLGTVRSRT
jgi:hypothetical protein